MFLDDNLLLFDTGTDLSAIQLFYEEEPILFIGKGSHTEVFSRGLKELDIPYEEIPNRRGSIVKPRGELYLAVGMGISIAEDKWFTLFGDSYTYRMGVNREHLEQIKPFLGKYELR